MKAILALTWMACTLAGMAHADSTTVQNTPAYWFEKSKALDPRYSDLYVSVVHETDGFYLVLKGEAALELMGYTVNDPNVTNTQDRNLQVGAFSCVQKQFTGGVVWNFRIAATLISGDGPGLIKKVNSFNECRASLNDLTIK